MSKVEIITGTDTPIETSVEAPVYHNHDLNNPYIEQTLNKIEKSFGEEFTPEEIGDYFGEAIQISTPITDLDRMTTIKEVKNYEYEIDNSADIYKIKARVQNLAGGNLGTYQEMLVNSYVHVLKHLYDFANDIKDLETKTQLVQLIRKNEDFPSKVIASAKAGVKNA